MDKKSYDKLSRWGHWFTALVFISMFAIGWYFHEMPRGDVKNYWRHLHISIGTLAWLLVMFRVVWRLRQGFLPAVEQQKYLQTISKISHWLLLLGVVIMFISGPLTIWSAGRAISVFDWFSIPSPMERMHEFHEFLENVHGKVARATMVLIVIHASAAIWHHIKHKGLLKGRMWG